MCTTNTCTDQWGLKWLTIEHVQIIVIHGFICLKRVARVTPVHHIEPVICVARNLYKKKKMHTVHITYGMTVLNVKCISQSHGYLIVNCCVTSPADVNFGCEDLDPAKE